MPHLYLLFLFFSLMVALFTAGVYLFLYQKHKISILKYYLYNHAAMVFFVFSVGFTFYLYLNMGVFNDFKKILFGYTFSTIFFSAPFIVTGPLFNRAMVNKPNTKNVKIFWGLISLISITLSLFLFQQGYLNDKNTLASIMRYEFWLFFVMWFAVVPLFSSIAYSNIILLKNYKTITDPGLKIGARNLILYGVFSIAMAVADYFAQRAQMLKGHYPVGIFVQPVMLLTFSSISLLTLLEIQKKNRDRTGVLPTAFIAQYQITDREKEIIAMILSGLSNKEIASKLFLSPSTVRNHISSIFEKTACRTRGKLQNLIRELK